MRSVIAQTLGLTLVLAACTSPPISAVRAELALALRATTAQGEPVAGVRVWAAARELGVTRSRGELDATLTGTAGERIVLSISCPSSHRTTTPRRELSFQPGPRSLAVAPVALNVVCQPIEHVHALVVRARGAQRANLPIEIDGRPIGQTDSDGVAHLLLRTRPHASVRVVLDTQRYPSLRPANPVQTFQIGDTDRVLLFDQPFSRVPGPQPRRSTSPSRSPYRID